MSSSPIEPTIHTPAPGLLRRALRPVGRVVSTWLHTTRPGRLLRIQIKSALPRGLFGRSFLILVTPFILVQAISAWVFYDRVWDTVARRLSAGVAGEISMVIEARHLLSPDSYELFKAQVSGATQLGFKVIPEATLRGAGPRPTGTLVEEQLVIAVRDRVRLPFQIDERSERNYVMLAIQLPDAVLQVSVPRKRLYTSTTYIFFMWMIGTGILTIGVGTLFLRNQVRSLRRMAEAVDAFGKGRDSPKFKPEGAAEVRKASAAFLAMRERIQRQITQRTEMLAGVSHDLRTPLTRMKLELELLGDGEDVQGLREDVAEMEQMIEGYLSFARGEGNETPEPTDVAALLRRAAATQQRDGSFVAVSAPEAAYGIVRRDALRRCLMNLLGNGARYGGKVWVTLQEERTGLVILIDDDGPGIPLEARETVFRPFYRLEGSRNFATGGVGLGLTIARDIARSHGGDLTLEDSPHGGLRARLTLPR